MIAYSPEPTNNEEGIAVLKKMIATTDSIAEQLGESRRELAAKAMLEAWAKHARLAVMMLSAGNN